MKIVVIDTAPENAPQAARAFLPKLLDGLTGKGDEIIRVIKYTKAPPSPVDDEGVWQLSVRIGNPLLHVHAIESEEFEALQVTDAARRLNELAPDIYFIWTAEEKGWSALPLIDPQTATLAIAHADSETFYAPVRHYRSFLTRAVGTTPETCVGLVLSCVIDKERVEWISYDAAEIADSENLEKTIETYRACFEKASADALAAPRERSADFPPLETSAPPSWFSRLKAKIMN